MKSPRNSAQQDKVKPGANGVLGTEAGSQRAQEQVHLKSTEFGKQN
jgi:hypothetical protein